PNFENFAIAKMQNFDKILALKFISNDINVLSFIGDNKLVINAKIPFFKAFDGFLDDFKEMALKDEILFFDLQHFYVEFIDKKFNWINEDDNKKILLSFLQSVEIRLNERNLRLLRNCRNFLDDLLFSKNAKTAENTNLAKSENLAKKTKNDRKKDLKIGVFSNEGLDVKEVTATILDYPFIEARFMLEECKIVTLHWVKDVNLDKIIFFPLTKFWFKNVDADFGSFSDFRFGNVNFWSVLTSFNEELNESPILESNDYEFCFKEKNKIQKFYFKTKKDTNINIISHFALQFKHLSEILNLCKMKKIYKKEDEKNSVLKCAKNCIFLKNEFEVAILLEIENELTRIEPFGFCCLVVDIDAKANIYLEGYETSPIVDIPLLSKALNVHMVIPKNSVAKSIRKYKRKLKRPKSQMSKLRVFDRKMNRIESSSRSFHFHKNATSSKCKSKSSYLEKADDSDDFDIVSSSESMSFESKGSLIYEDYKEKQSSFLVLMETIPQESATKILLHSSVKILNKTEIDFKIDSLIVKKGEEKWLSLESANAGNFDFEPLFGENSHFECEKTKFWFESVDSVCKIVDSFLKRDPKSSLTFCFVMSYDRSPKQKTIKIFPFFRFVNCLPEDIVVTIDDNKPKLIKSGSSSTFFNVQKESKIRKIEMGRIGFKTTKEIIIRHNLKKLGKSVKTIKIEMENDEKVKFKVSCELKLKNFKLSVSLFVPIWLFDFTDKNLIFKSAKDGVSISPPKKSKNTINCQMVDEDKNSAFLLCKTPNSKNFSDPFSLEAIETISTISNVTESQQNKILLIELTYKTIFGKDKFFRTKIAKFHPKFVVQNKLPFSILLRTSDIDCDKNDSTSSLVTIKSMRTLITFPKSSTTTKSSPSLTSQKRKNSEIKIGENEVKMFYFALEKDNKLGRKISIKDEKEEFDWSSFVDVEMVGENYLKLSRFFELNRFLIVSVDIILKGATYFIVFYMKDLALLPFLIENRTLDTKIQITQINFDSWITLGSKQSIYFAWNDPNKLKKIKIRIKGDTTTEKILPFQNNQQDKIKIGALRK
ncbi:hypothetical protein MHBO_000364, partial [Bonamia ostreae]